MPWVSLHQYLRLGTSPFVFDTSLLVHLSKSTPSYLGRTARCYQTAFSLCWVHLLLITAGKKRALVLTDDLQESVRPSAVTPHCHTDHQSLEHPRATAGSAFSRQIVLASPFDCLSCWLSAARLISTKHFCLSIGHTLLHSRNRQGRGLRVDAGCGTTLITATDQTVGHGDLAIISMDVRHVDQHGEHSSPVESCYAFVRHWIHGSSVPDISATLTCRFTNLLTSSDSHRDPEHLGRNRYTPAGSYWT